MKVRQKKRYWGTERFARARWAGKPELNARSNLHNGDTTGRYCHRCCVERTSIRRMYACADDGRSQNVRSRVEKLGNFEQTLSEPCGTLETRARDYCTLTHSTVRSSCSELGMELEAKYICHRVIVRSVTNKTSFPHAVLDTFPSYR